MASPPQIGPNTPRQPSFTTPATQVTIQPDEGKTLGIVLRSEGLHVVKHVISDVTDDGLAAHCDVIAAEDVIVEVNGTSVLQESHDAVVQRIARGAGQPLRLTTVAPAAFDRLVKELGLSPHPLTGALGVLTVAQPVMPHVVANVFW